jgi:signal transduction histidine kinase
MTEALTAALAAGVAGGYFAIAALIVPKIELRDATPRFVRAFRFGGIAFFVGCGLTHVHIAYHAVADAGRADTHEILFHLLQVFGVWLFVFAALRYLDVAITRRPTPADELQVRVDELARSNADLQEFAHVVAHDLQAPLQTVAGFAQLLERRYAGHLDDGADEYLHHIVDGSQRMGELLDGVLAYSRAAGVGLERSEVDLGAIVHEAQEALVLAIADRGARVTTDALPHVEGDATQLRQLVFNLLGNALKFGADRVHVSATREGGFWCVSVRDNGQGVDPRETERIFEMFQRSQYSDGADGAGLGLALAHKIVERHGGRIWVEPSVAGGSVFRFTLPRVPAVVA